MESMAGSCCAGTARCCRSGVVERETGRAKRGTPSWVPGIVGHRLAWPLPSHLGELETGLQKRVASQLSASEIRAHISTEETNKKKRLGATKCPLD